MAFDLVSVVAVAAMKANPAAATLEDFERALGRHDSATLALEEWCGARGLARPARIVAKASTSPDGPQPAGLPATLELQQGQTFALRNVRLICGRHVLSVAWNWYVPSRLTPAMNAALATTDVPFGKVVAPLGFKRRALAIAAGPAAGCPSDTISTHRAMLVLPDGRPLAYLVECYTAANLAVSGR